jgi:DHA1 family multidrug resistance protein-like MFS transporter
MVGIQFIVSMAFSVMMPFLPLYLIQLHVHPVSAVEVWAGVLNSANFLVSALVSPYWGRLADQRGRKLMVLRSSSAVALFTGLMGLAGNVWELFALRLLMGAFSGFSAASIALVGAEVPDDQLGYSLGWLQSGALVGSVVGPMVGGFLASVFQSYRVVFFATSLLAFLATVMVLLVVQERYRPLPEPSPARSGRPSLVALLRGAAGPMGAMLVVLFMAQLATRTVSPIITIFVRTLVGPRAHHLATLAGAAFAVTGVADFIGSPFLGKRSDQIGYRRVLLILVGGAALTFLPQAFVRSIWAFLALRFALGLFLGGIIPTANAYIGHLTPPERRGSVFGATASATFLGNFAGPLLGGAVAASLGIPFTFLATALLLILTWLWLYLRVTEDAPVPSAERVG